MDLNSIASAATAVGVLIAAWQIWQSRKLASASFEDFYDQQYRELMYRVPVDALLGKKLNGHNDNEAREAIYNYLDLCNEQVYQRSKRRVSKARWAEWRSGIRDNLEKPLIFRHMVRGKKQRTRIFFVLGAARTERIQIGPRSLVKLHNQGRHGDAH